MKRILTGVVAGLIGLAFSTTTFGQGAPPAPPMPPGAMEKGEEMKERAAKHEEKMKERAAETATGK